MPKTDISVILNAHREGLLVVPTMKSIENAVSSAVAAGLSVEVIAVLDRADFTTRCMFSEWSASYELLSVHHVEYGDLGLSRNYGVELAEGRWIAFLDADDLWSANWLTSSFNIAISESRLSVWHPETNLYFGARPHVFVHIDMDDPAFDPCFLVETNAWTALCFTSKELLTQVPYRTTAHNRQIGYEDWGWNIETISFGAIHKTVPDTSHAVRTKAVSLVSQTTAARCLPHPSNYFRSILAERERSRANVPHHHQSTLAA